MGSGYYNWFSNSSTQASTVFSRGPKAITKLAFCLLMGLAISGCQSVESHRSIEPTRVKTPVLQSSTKHRIFVSSFNNQSDYQRGVFSSDKDRMGEQAKAILKSHLQMTKGFSLMERDQLQELAKEHSIAGGTQQLKGASLAISGSVTEFGRKVTGDKQLFGILGKGKAQVAYSKVALNVVDVKTAEVLFSVQGAGEYALNSREVVGFGSSAGYDATLNGKVLDLAITEAVSRLIEGLNAGEF